MTHYCAVLGDPIDHSLSPALHEAAYRQLGLDGWEYRKVRVNEQELKPWLESLTPQWAGLSLTMPLKRTIVPYGTLRDRWSQTLGVANTAVLRWDGGHKPSIGLYNTDVFGIAQAFAHAHETAPSTCRTPRTALILGNGNTAASAVAACASMGVASVTVAARHVRANDAMERIMREHAGTLRMVALDSEAALEALADSDVVVNTIPAGFAQPVADMLAASGVQVRGMLLDVIYGAGFSSLRSVYRSRGGLFVDGRDMLLYQALAQVLLMTGVADPLESGVYRLPSNMGTLEQAMRHAIYR